MFSFFQTDFFKKKASDNDGQSKDDIKDDFVIVEDENSSSADKLYPQVNNSWTKPYGSKDWNMPVVTERLQTAEPSSLNTISVQDVPFELNPIMQCADVVDRIWRSIEPYVSSLSQPFSLTMDYDFSLERSVVLESAKN